MVIKNSNIDAMPEFKFSCPKCHQPVQCDSTFAGSQINCPLCGQAITVPPATPSLTAPGERTLQVKASTLKTVTLIGLSVLLAVGMVLLAVHFLAGPTTLTFRAFVDGTDVVKLSGNKLWIEHQVFTRPDKISINGKKWNPVWNGNTSMPYDLSPAFHPRHAENIKLINRAGRGTITILEMPSPENQQTLSIQVDDGPYPGADWYELAVSW
jgi:DNA-directed RNA polymerase subunit RPC12/RpoP